MSNSETRERERERGGEGEREGERDYVYSISVMFYLIRLPRFLVPSPQLCSPSVSGQNDRVGY